jgi:putative nucleotidyltransferase with HDIG domain
MAIRPVNTNFLALKLARSPARALRDLRARNISVNIFGCGKLSVNDGYDLKKAMTRFKKLGICPQLDHRVIARTIREAGSPAVIRALEYRGITDFDAARAFFPEEIWSEDLYDAIQNIFMFTKNESMDEGARNRYSDTWNSFRKYACSAANQDDRNLVVKVLFDMMEMHDWQTALHSKQARDWAISIARQMGLPEKEIKAIGLAAYLHDIGKIGIPKKILQKQGGLNKEELSHIRNIHVMLGCSLLKDCGWTDDILEMIKYHHYTKSYPEGIDPEKAPLGARILAVADSVEAATAGRVYEKEMTLKTVLCALRVKKNNYDRNVVDAFEKIMKKSH